MPVSPASPPKRMTRARAKAVEEKTKTAKVTAPSSRAGTAPKLAATKRKTAVEDEDDIEAGPTRPARKVSTKPTVAQSRRGIQAKPTTDSTSVESNHESQPVTVVETRGRPRKGTASKEISAATQSTASTAARARTRAEPISRTTTATKKSVTFQDRDEDKENAPIGAAKGKKTAKPAAGISAKPVRKTPAASTTTKRNAPTARSAASSQPRTAPLSPKKDTQVAKGNAAGGPSDLAESIDELQLDSGSCMSPTRKAPTSVMASPARRPPNSPFKDTFKDPLHDTSEGASTSKPRILSQSPRKFNISSPSKSTVFDANSNNFGNSLLGSPARKPSSPMKNLAFGTPAGSKSVQKDLNMSILTSKSPQKFTPATDMAAINKAAEVNSINCLLATVEEHAASLEDELLNAPSPFSPVKKAMEEDVFDLAGSPIADSETNFDHMDVDTPQPASKSQAFAFPPRTPGSPACYDDDSEDELSTDNIYHSTPAALKTRLSTHFKGPTTPVHALRSTTPEADVPQESLTVLAGRFGQWQTATPDPDVLDQRKAARSIFSPLPHLARPNDGDDSAPTSIASTPESSHIAPTSFFDDAMPISIHEDVEEHMAVNEIEEGLDQDQDTEHFFRQSQISEASQVYGDENEVPIDPALFDAPTALPTVAQTCTPERTVEERPRIIHTISKVPLKGCDDFDASPIAMPRKRSQSLAGALSPHADLELQAMRQMHPSASSIELVSRDAASFSAQVSDLSQTLPSCQDSLLDVGGYSTPGANSSLLSGAVVFVDVHTTEGADASGLFVELLTQMGAKCVKSWNWNSRASAGNSVTEAAPVTPTTKIGITHVVFKDGGKRTMEKVREAQGRVSCVGVGWVLE